MLPFAALRSSALRLPVPIAWRKLSRATRKRIRHVAPGALAGKDALLVGSLLETDALVEQLRAARRKQARRGTGRTSARNLAEYATTPEGRHVARLLDRLADRLRVQEARLCG